jgi:ABC-type glutathione transport system ATPase component
MLSVHIKSIKIKRKNSEKLLLNNINFQLESNQINVILGQNGIGKSTLIKSLTRLLDERFYEISGSIMFNNKDITQATQDELLTIRKTEIGYVFQDAINSFDPLKKIGYYFRHYKNASKISYYFEDLLLPSQKMVFNLYPYEVSGGMAQRILFTLALLKDPEILILDEPTSGIDSPISNLVLLKLREFVRGKNKSVLLVTQDLKFANNAGDRISFLSEGTLSSFYNKDDFFEKQNISAFKNFIAAYNQLL